MDPETMKLIGTVLASLVGALAAFSLAGRQAIRVETGKLDVVADRFDEILRQLRKTEEIKSDVASSAKARQEHNLVLRQKIEELAYQAIAFGDALQSTNPYKNEGPDPATPVLFRMTATVSLYFPELKSYIDEFHNVHFMYRDRQLMEPRSGEFDPEEVLDNVKRLTGAIDGFTLALKRSLDTMLA